MRLDLPYVCEFCHAKTRKINRMDVSTDDEGEDGSVSSTKALMFVCDTCKDNIVDLAVALSEADDPDLHIDLQSDELNTDSEQLRDLWESLCARRKRF